MEAWRALGSGLDVLGYEKISIDQYSNSQLDPSRKINAK
jgi:hypothetical protein